MSHTLKNKDLEVQVDLPMENYTGPRFDWTGKIARVYYQGLEVTGAEHVEPQQQRRGGQGFYNEFGIESPLGFEEARKGDWFHKIGIGLLQKKEGPYHFQSNYAIRPCAFEVRADRHILRVTCSSDLINGYAYCLEKKTVLLEDGFEIRYSLINTGERSIVTDEYNHNFVAINGDPVGTRYRLTFPFQPDPKRFSETVNPDGIAMLGGQEVRFSGTPHAPFFFGHMNGDVPVEARWELINERCRTGIRETGNFRAGKVNLWGARHVISPELFIKIAVPAGQSMDWTRTYRMFRTG